MQIGFAGKVAVVTGTTHGIGRAIAEGLAARGASVWACDVLPADRPEGPRDGGGHVHHRRLDVTDAAAVSALVAEAGPVDLLAHSAGGVCGQVHRPIEEVPESDWQAIFAVNVTGAFNLAKAVAPGMKQRRAGRIVTISSGAGLQPSLTGIQAYCAAKHAEIGLTRQLAHELGPWGITVNSVAPGFVRSNPATERQWESYGPEGQKRLVESIALRRTGEPEDIANAVMFLLSDHASYVTGQVLSVNGGR